MAMLPGAFMVISNGVFKLVSLSDVALLAVARIKQIFSSWYCFPLLSVPALPAVILILFLALSALSAIPASSVSSAISFCDIISSPSIESIIT